MLKKYLQIMTVMGLVFGSFDAAVAAGCYCKCLNPGGESKDMGCQPDLSTCMNSACDANNFKFAQCQPDSVCH